MFINGTDETGSSIQQYCLRWNNHRSNLLLVFEHLFQTEAFTDVTLACDGESIKCHKMVLAACSSYFQQLFMENTCRHPIVILKDIRESEIRAILEYMYKGEVNVAQDQLAGLLKAAETLKVKGLVEDNNQRTASNTPAPTPPQQSSSPYHPPSLQQQLPPATTSSSSQHHPEQPHFFSTASSSGNHPGVANTTAYNVNNNSSSNNTTPNNGNGNGKTGNSLLSSATKYNAISNDSSETFSPYCNASANTNATPPERILNALPFPVWPNKLNLSPKNGNGNGNGNSNIVNSNNNSGGNVSVNNNSSFESSLLLPNDQPVPLKKKRFMTASSSPSSSLIVNKDTPILRTVLGHTCGSSSNPLNLNSIDHPHKTLSYPYSATGAAAAPITTNGPIDAPEQLRLDRERERERERDRDRDRDQDSPVDLFMDDSARSVDSDRTHDDNHPFGMDDDKKGGLALYVPSQKPEWKRYKQYTRNDIMAAIDAVRAGMSALQAARKFGVPSRTLYDKVKKLGITTNRPYRKGSFPMSPYQGMNMKDDNSSYSPEEMPLDISSAGNGLGHMGALGPEGDSDKMDSDPSSSTKRDNSPPLDYKDEFIHEPHPENGSENCSSTSPRDRDQLEPEDMRSHSE